MASKTSTAAAAALAWAKAQPPKPSGGKKCWICVNPQALEAAEELLRLRDEGASLAYGQIGAYLREKYGYPFKDSGVQRHNLEHRQVRR